MEIKNNVEIIPLSPITRSLLKLFVNYHVPQELKNYIKLLTLRYTITNH